MSQEDQGIRLPEASVADVLDVLASGPALSAADLAAVIEEDGAVNRTAEYLERRQADAEILEVLAAAEFRGPFWDEFAERLIRYGYQVIGAWVRSGDIFARCSLAGVGVAGNRIEWTSEDQNDLIQETLIEGLLRFRRALSAGIWTVRGGASLKTYFIRACLMAFANSYRKWAAGKRNEAALARLGDQAGLLAARRDPGADVESAVLTSLAADEELARLAPRTRAVLELKAAGYTHVEIAEITGTTPGAIEAIVYRHRRRRSRRDD